MKSPGRYSVETNATVLDAIALAGGITEKGAGTVYLLRPDASGVTQRTQVRVDTRDILDPGGTGLAAMQPLHGGDSIVVPKSTFTIVGQVTTPGEYRLESGMTLFQAEARAGGVTQLGSSSRVEIRRLGPDGKYVDIKGSKDMRIESGDVIRVKERLF